jgi:hypothetical protein
MAVLPALCGGLTKYVPTPPAPVPSAVIVVGPAVSVVPLITMPTASVPEVAAETVRTLPVMPPVTPTKVADVVPTNAVEAGTVCDGLTVYVGPPPPVIWVPSVTP